MSLHQAADSVQRLGLQLERTVEALTKAREEASTKGEELRRAHQDLAHLADKLALQQDLHIALQDQVREKK